MAETYGRRGTATPVLTGFASYADYLAFVLEAGTTPNGVFGAKLMWGYLDDFLLYLREIPAYKDLPAPKLFSTIFPQVRYIHIARQDKVRQAISLWRAIQTWTWRQDQAAPGSSSDQISTALVFHYEAIDFLVQRIISHERSWAQYFTDHGIQPFETTYEELTNAYEETVDGLLRYLGISFPETLVFARPQMRRQSDELSEQWVKRYHQIQQQTKQ